MKNIVAFVGAVLLMTACSEEKTEFVNLKNERMSVRIKSAGAEIKSIKASNSDREIMWIGTADDLWTGTSPIMFPVAVRFTNNEYTYKDDLFEMPLLGIVNINKLQLTHSSVDSATFVLEANDQTRKNYPFDFRFSVTYRLEGKALVNEFHIENLGEEDMPYAMGGHPGFVLPLTDGKTRDDFELTFSNKISTDRPVLIEGAIGPEFVPFLDNESELGLTDARVPDYGMVLLGHEVERIGVAIKGEEPFVEIKFDDFPNVNLWSPSGVPFVAIEPMIGHHDFAQTTVAVEGKDYLLTLGGGQAVSYSYSILVHY